MAEKKKIFIWDFTGTIACHPYEMIMFAGSDRVLVDKERLRYKVRRMNAFCDALDLPHLTFDQIKKLPMLTSDVAAFYPHLDEKKVQEAMDVARMQVNEKYHFLPGARKMLKYIKSQGWSNILLSGGGNEKVHTTIRRERAYELFDGIFTADDGVDKCDETIRDFLPADLKNAEIWVIGNDEAEMKMASILGARSVFLGRPAQTKNLSEELTPDFVLDSHHRLLHFFKNADKPQERIQAFQLDLDKLLFPCHKRKCSFPELGRELRTRQKE